MNLLTHTPRHLADQFRQAFRLLACEPPDCHAARPLLTTCLAGDPGNLLFAETFLRVLDRVRPAGHWSSGFWRRLRFQQALDQQRWDDVLCQGPTLLALRPHDASLLRALAAACRHRGASDVALRYVSRAVTWHPDDVGVQRDGARLFTEQGLFEAAQRCWQAVLRTVDDDPEARRRLAALAEAPQRPRSPIGQEKPAAIPDPGAAAERCRRLLEQGQWEAAEQCIEQALAIWPHHLTLVACREQSQLARAEAKLRVARRQTPADDSAMQQLVTDLEADLLRQEIEIWGARAARFPEEPKWRAGLARRLMRCGNYDQAIRLLTPLAEAPCSTANDLVALGECYQYLRQFGQALDCYRRAVERFGPDPPIQPIYLLALRRAGVLAWQWGDLERAELYLRRLLDVEPANEVARQHLDKLASIRHKEGFPNHNTSASGDAPGIVAGQDPP